MATQNPIESEGVYPLPEAQRDRFLMKVPVGYPSRHEEVTIVDRMGVRPPRAEPVLTPSRLVRLQVLADAVFVHPALVDYAVRLVQATRDPATAGVDEVNGQIAFGASPRASLGLIASARALSLLRGRSYALAEDVADCFLDVLRHRLVLSYDALADGRDPDELLRHVQRQTKAPRLVPREDAEGGPAPDDEEVFAWRTEGSA
jgi:MoxR-like ATPase